MRTVFLLYCAFAALADLWLNPITYVLIGIIVTLRQYLERLPPSGMQPATVPTR